MNFHAFHRYAATQNLGELDVTAEQQGSDYESGQVKIDGELWRIRTARVTPRKPGAFVAVWRRNAHGETEPFSVKDGVAGLVVFVQDGSRFGVFTFSATSLAELGIYRSEHSAGKRGFRLYPAWSTDLNTQAMRTQAAQAPFFKELI